MTAWAAILFCALPRDVLLVWEPKNPKNCLKYANTNVLSIVYIYIKAKPAPNSASDWPPSWFCALPETSCLSGSRKTPKTAQKNPFLTRNGTIRAPHRKYLGSHAPHPTLLISIAMPR